MKKTITVIALLAGAVTGYSQGQITFYGYSVQNGSTLKQAIFNAESGSYSVTYGGSTVFETIGSVAATVNAHESPVGTTTYTSAQLGGTTGAPADAVLLANLGTGDAINTLVATGTVLPFYTTAAGTGFIKGVTTDTLGTGVAQAGSTFTVAIAAWTINAGGDQGAANTLATAIADATLDKGEADDGGYSWGISDTANVVSPTGVTPAGMPTTIESFSLGVAVPEPSTIALGKKKKVQK
jgi:hypothetical protein